AGVVRKTVDAMRSAGAVVIQAWLGPSVCGNCYEVPAELREQVSDIEPSAYGTTSWGTPALDLPAAVMYQLQAMDVQAQRINVCTMEEPLLFSHRRDAPTGRFAGVIYARR
ncbi:MAG: polyphenol oxidase family protein, partial [Acidobacteria bacterium]|nr:polyphenol oxidase family protein [Acidobacteriota bacterium]